MANNVQEILNFLYKVTIEGEGLNIFEDDNFTHGIIDTIKSVKNFNKKEIYDELTDFAFLTLYNNSLIKIDEDKLYDMVKKGIFVREVNNQNFEGMYLKRKIQELGERTDEGVEIIDQFGQKSIVRRKDKSYVVTTKCPNIVACNYQSRESVDPSLIVQIIRNSLIHNRFREVSEKEKEMYSDIFKEDVNGKGYIFKSYNNSIDILVTESWLREFKKIYFLDSYCYVSSEDNTFYFPRFITAKNTPIKNEEELEEVLNSVLNTSIIIHDKDKNFMNTRNLIEENLFMSVYAKDKKFKYELRKKSGEELKQKLKEHHLRIEEFIRKTLESKGYKDFEIKFESESLDENKHQHFEFWKNRLKYIFNFYKDDNLDIQLYNINRVCGVIPTTGFNKKENLKGITPQMISLFLSVVESMDMQIIRVEKIRALQDYVDDPRNLENIFLIDKLRSMVVRKTPNAIETAFNVIAGKIDTEKYNKLVIDNHFESFFANIELAYVTACASLYNSIIRSGFYENYLKRNENNEYAKLNDEAYKVLSNMDMSEFLINKNGEINPCENYGEKMSVLAYIRHVLLHGGAEIDYSSLSGNISDIRIKFKRENSNFEVSCTISNIMKLANEKVLYKDIEIKNHKKAKKGKNN